MIRDLALFLRQDRLARTLAVLFAVGLVGHLLPIPWLRQLMSWLTPIALLVTGGVTLWPDLVARRKSFLLWLAFSLVASFFLEVAGVATGVIFGRYEYGFVLGPKLLDVPPIIGLNWVILVLGFTRLARRILPERMGARWIVAPFSGALICLFDVLLEPMAIHLDYWSWADLLPPLRNFVAWFAAGTVLAALLPFSRRDPTRPDLAQLNVIIQTFYFLVLFLATNLLRI